MMKTVICLKILIKVDDQFTLDVKITTLYNKVPKESISWEKILKSSPQKRFMMGHTLKSSPILREPEPDFGDSTAPFQDNIFKIIFNLQVMGCLPHHFDTLQSNNPQFPLQANEQSIPSIIITEEESSENNNSIKKKISNKSRIPRHNPVSDECNREGSSSENVPQTPSEQSVISDNEHMSYNDNGLPEILDSLEIPHCSYKKYKELKNNYTKECNEYSNYLGNQNTIVLREDLNNNMLKSKGLISSSEEAYKCDNYKTNKNYGSRNIKVPAFTVKQGSIHENSYSETEKSSFESRKLKTELCKNSFNEGSEDVSNELKMSLQANNEFDDSHLFEHETVNSSDNWKNFSGFHDNKYSFVLVKGLKNMTDGPTIETVLNGSTESHISEVANRYSCEQNSVNRENPICYAVSSELEVNEKHNDEVISDNETVNNECDNSIVRKLEAQLNKFDANISLRLVSNSQTFLSKQEVETKLFCKSNDDQYYQKPIEINSLPSSSENTNILINENDNYRHQSESNDVNYLNDSNSHKNAFGISKNVLILQDNLDKNVSYDIKPLCITGNNCDNSNNMIKNDVNSNDENFECNILQGNLRDQINDEILEIKQYCSDICREILQLVFDHSDNYNINLNNEILTNDHYRCDQDETITENFNEIIAANVSNYFKDIVDNANKNIINDIKEFVHELKTLQNTLDQHEQQSIQANEMEDRLKDLQNIFNSDHESECDEQIATINDIRPKIYSLNNTDSAENTHKNKLNEENNSESSNIDIDEQIATICDIKPSISSLNKTIIVKDTNNKLYEENNSNSSNINIDEQLATLCGVKPSITSLDNTVTIENTNKIKLNEENNSRSLMIDINVANDKNYKNENSNFDCITYGVEEDTQTDESTKINSVKTSECQFRFSEENTSLLHSVVHENSPESKKSNSEINCNILQTNSRNNFNNSLNNNIEECHFEFHSNFSTLNGGITLEQDHRKNSKEQVVQNEPFDSEKEGVIRDNIKNELECNFDIESHNYLTSESVNDIDKSYSHDKIEESYEENYDAEQWLLKNYETRNINQYSQLNNVERLNETENEFCSSMQRQTDVMGLLENRLILAEKLESQSEKNNESEEIEPLNLKHDFFPETSDNQYLDFNNFEGNSRKKWDISSGNETVFNAFDNSDEEKSIIDVESIDSVGYYANNICDNSFLQNITINDQVNCSLFDRIFGKTDDNINSYSFNEPQENNVTDTLGSFMLQNVSNSSQESETDKEHLSNVNPINPIAIDSHKCFIDKEEWGEIQSYDYLEFIIDRINIKTRSMECNQIDNIQIKQFNNDKISDINNSLVNQESNQFSMKEREEETSSEYLDDCLKKYDIAQKENEHTNDCSQELRYDIEYYTEDKSLHKTSNIIFIPDKESENRNFKCENNSSLQNLETDGKILDKDVDVLSTSEKDTNCRFKHFEVSKVSEDLQKESGLWTERNLSSSSESQSFHDLGTLHNSSVYKRSSADIENLNNDIKLPENIAHKTNADSVHSIPDICQTYYNSNSEGSSQNNIIGNLPIAANYINSRFLAAETSECNIAPNNKEVKVTNINTRNTLKPENNINTGQKQSFDMFWEYDGYYSKSYNEDFEAHKTCEDTSDEKYKFYKEIFEKMIEEIGDIEKEQSSENIKEKHESNVYLNKIKDPETQRQDMNCEPSNESFKRGYGNLDVYNKSSSDKFSGSKVYWSSVGLVVENNDDPNTLPCCEQSDENFMEEAESGCVDLIYPEEGKKNLGAEDNFGSSSDTAVNSNIDFISNIDALQPVRKQDNCDELGEPVLMKAKKKNKFIQRIRSFFSSSRKVGTKAKKIRGDE